MNAPTSEQLDQFARVLGDLLRTARKERGWTRKQMRAEMGAGEEDEVSLQTPRHLRTRHTPPLRRAIGRTVRRAGTATGRAVAPRDHSRVR
jgi:hypothetical protein